MPRDALGWGSVGDADLEFIRAAFAPPDPDATVLRLTVMPHARDAPVEIDFPFFP